MKNTKLTLRNSPGSRAASTENPSPGVRICSILATGRKYIIPALLVILLGFLSNCKKEDEGPELIAEAGPDTTASIGDTVWLDAGGSSGKGYSIEWTIQSQPGDDTITFSHSDSAFLIPMHNGSYQIKLTISKGGLFTSDFMELSVSGSIILEDVTSSTRLNKIAEAGERDYIVRDEFAVTAELTIGLGVIIEFTENASMVIRDGGEIHASGASFIASDSTWKGIAVHTAGNTFENCLIENAGNASFTSDEGQKAAVTLMSGATMAFSGNTMKYSGEHGIRVLEGGSFFEDTRNRVFPFRNNHFNKNALGPMIIPVDVLSELSGQFFEEETEGSFIEIFGSSYPASKSSAPWFSDQGLPYLIGGLLEFNKDLTVNSGVELYFAADAGLKVSGKLTVSGTSTDPVIMDGASPGTGFWKGIYVHEGQVDLNYLSILNAGSTIFSGLGEKAALRAEQLLTMRNSTISGSGGTGLSMPGTAHIQIAENFTGNTISNNEGPAVRIRMDDVSKVVNGNTISSGTGIPAVEVHMGKDDPLGTWADLDADYDYRITESLLVKSTKELVIEAGTVIKMPVGATITVNGGLTAIGTSGSVISIIGMESKKGHWDGIFLNNSLKVELDYVKISDGGGGFEDKANLIVEPGATDVTVTNSTFNNSKGYGVLIKTGASGFAINDPASNNTLEGDLGGFRNENN